MLTDRRKKKKEERRKKKEADAIQDPAPLRGQGKYCYEELIAMIQANKYILHNDIFLMKSKAATSCL